MKVTLFCPQSRYQHPLFLNGKRTELIGRNENADICIKCREVSKIHAILVNIGTDDEPVPLLRDLGSRNGTHVQGVDLRDLPKKEATLELGWFFILSHNNIPYMIVDAANIPEGEIDSDDHTMQIEV